MIIILISAFRLPSSGAIAYDMLKQNQNQIQIPFMIIKIGQIRTVAYQSFFQLLKLAFSTTEQFGQAKYSERPFTPLKWNGMLMQNLCSLQKTDKKKMVSHILHQFSLYYHEVVPFSYDYFYQNCSVLSFYQKELSLNEILLILRLGIGYKVKHELFSKHIENELHLRIYDQYQEQLIEYYRNLDQQYQLYLKKMEEQSKDFFRILNQEQSDQKNPAQKQQTQEAIISSSQEEDHERNISQAQMKEDQVLEVLYSNIKSGQANVSRIAEQKNVSRTEVKKKSITLDILFEIATILRINGSTNLDFIQYLMQLLTIELSDATAITPLRLISHIQLLNFNCQAFMNEYYSNRKDYTARSIKRIYHFQTHYYSQHFFQISHVVKHMNNQDILNLVQAYTAFPIKRRAIRRNIGKLIVQQLTSRNLQADQRYIQELMKLNKKDIKMNNYYCELLGIISEKRINQQISAVDPINPGTEKKQNFKENAATQ